MGLQGEKVEERKRKIFQKQVEWKWLESPSAASAVVLRTQGCQPASSLATAPVRARRGTWPAPTTTPRTRTRGQHPPSTLAAPAALGLEPFNTSLDAALHGCDCEHLRLCVCSTNGRLEQLVTPRGGVWSTSTQLPGQCGAPRRSSQGQMQQPCASASKEPYLRGDGPLRLSTLTRAGAFSRGTPCLDQHEVPPA